MTLDICPAAVVQAPAAVIWDLIADPAHLNTWIDGQVVQVDPPRPATPGQRWTIHSPAMGRTWKVRALVELVDADAHRLGTSWVFPLGIRLQEVISIASVDAVTSRVQYG